MKEKIKVYVKRACEEGEVISIPNRLDCLQGLVGGYIEAVSISAKHNLVAICNEEGRLMGLPYNCTIKGIDFYGDIVLASADMEDFTDIIWRKETLEMLITRR